MQYMKLHSSWLHHAIEGSWNIDTNSVILRYTKEVQNHMRENIYRKLLEFETEFTNFLVKLRNKARNSL